MLKIFIILFGVTFMLQVNASDSNKLQDIRKFFELTNVAELSFADIKRNTEMQRKANPQIPNQFWNELLKALKPTEYIEKMVPIYDKHFTHDEIKAWIVFFKSDAGQTFLKKQRMVLEESLIAGQAYVQEIGGPILRRMRE